MNNVPEVASAFAPASVGNVAIGFDILGFSVGAIGDRATVRRIREPEVRIKAIRGVVADLPMEAAKNTAGRALQAMREALALPFGLELELDKGIPLASGLGGSAASAVAAVVAANAVLPQPCSKLELLKFAMQGEAVASGSLHVDNIALTDNVVRYVTSRYCDNPLIVQGPGAGPAVTAGGVFADLLRLATFLGARL